MQVLLKKLGKKLWYSVFSDHPYTYPGRLLVRMLPESRKSQFYDELFSSQLSPGLFAGMARFGFARQHRGKSDQEIRSLNREKLWGGAAGKRRLDAKHEQDIEDKEVWTEHRGTMLSVLQELLAGSSSYHTILEIGTGHGAFLDLMSSRYTSIKRFVGLDLNRELILKNQETYRGTALEFVEGEVSDWINTCGGGGIIFVVMGVFEFFTQSELEELLDLIREKVSPAAVALAEPIDFDLTREIESKPRGVISYSHNYPYLLAQHNYEVFRQIIERTDSNQAVTAELTMVAKTSSIEPKPVQGLG